MDHSEIPTYENFLDYGLQDVNPEDITEDERDKCSGCFEVFGEPNADGVVEELVRLLGCRHIMGRGCLEEWTEEHGNTTCPICRRELFILDYSPPPVFQVLAHGALTLVPLSAEASAALRARDVEVNFDMMRHAGSLMVNLAMSDQSSQWPPELGVTMADVQGVAEAASVMTDWLFNNYTERLQPGVSNYGAASVEAAWAEISDEFVGPLTMRCTAMFIQTFLVRHLGGLGGVITHEHLVTLADAI